jgi:hypothetical protein
MSKAGATLSFEDVFRRLSEVTDIKTATNLAEAMGITSASVSKQKLGDTFPAAWLITLAERYQLDLNYLAFGKHFADRQRGEDIDVFLRKFMEKHLGLDYAPHKDSCKIIRGEIMELLDRVKRSLRS